MKRIIITIIFIFITSLLSAKIKSINPSEEYIRNNKIIGTVVIESLKTHKIYIYNQKRAATRFLPASTFKIVNTLIALQEKAVKDENEIIKWDRQDKGLLDWNKDQNIKSAFPVSCVWFYQELAKKIGDEKYLLYLKKMDYGNAKTGKAVDSFWLDGDLRISAIEQLEVMKKIYNENYNFDKKYYEILKTLMIVDKKEHYVVRAKTGTALRVTPNIGWYVGYIEVNNDVWFFACNLEMTKPEDGRFRKELIYNALKGLKIID